MSGPKYGQIIIGKIRRIKLMKELDRELEARDCRTLKKKQVALQAEVDDFISKHPIHSAENLLTRAKECAKDSVQYKKLSSYVLEYKNLCTQKCSMEGDSKALQEGRTQSIERLFRMGNLADMIKHAAKKLEKFIDSDDWKGAEIVTGIVSLEDKELDALYNELIDELSQSEGFEKAKAVADEIMDSVDFDNEHKKNLMRMRLESIRGERASSAALRAQRIELEEKIATLCDYLGREIPELSSDIRQLMYLADSLRAEAEQLTMGEYITESLQDAMERMGYDIIGEDTLVTTKHETHKSFYEFSDSSMLNVSSNEEGAVLFEVVGRSESGELSDAEKLSVKSDMDKFCPDYSSVKELLAEYDLTVTDERTCEADVRYVRAVKTEAIASARRNKKTKSRRMNSDE